MEVPYIGILGAGLMGHGLVQVFATQKCDVTLYDRDPQALSDSISRIRSNMEVFVLMGFLDSEELENALCRIHIEKNLADMCRSRTFIVEAISENVEVKRQAFSEMEKHVPPETILASNTSAIPISSIARN